MAEITQRSPGSKSQTTSSRELGVTGGLLGGLLAGGVFALGEMIVAEAMGMSWTAPWQAFASVVLGSTAMEGGLTFWTFIVGFMAHFGIAGTLGAIWGLIASFVPSSIRSSYGSHSAAAAIYGLVVYLVNFQLIARVLYPWFLGMNQMSQLLLHALAFGAPLGLILTAFIRSTLRAVVGRRAEV